MSGGTDLAEEELEERFSEGRSIVRVVLGIGGVCSLFGLNGVLALARMFYWSEVHPDAGASRLLGYTTGCALLIPSIWVGLMMLRPSYRNPWSLLNGASLALALAVVSNGTTLMAAVNGARVQAALARADMLIAQRDYAGAAKSYQDVVSIDEEHAEAWCSLGFLLLEAGEGNSPEAMRAFHAAIRLEPEFADPHQGLGVLHEQLGDSDVAATHYREAARLCPLGVFVPSDLLQRGRDLRKDLSFEEALATYDRAILRAPDCVEAWRCRTAILEAEDEWEFAIDGYRGLISLGIHEREIYSALAEKEWLVNGVAEQLSVWDAWLALEPDDAEAHFERGCLLDMLDRMEEGLRAFERATALDPNHLEAHLELAGSLELLGDPAAALVAYEASSRIDPTCVDAIYSCGVLLGESGRFNEAREAFERSVELDPSHADSWGNLSWILMDLGDNAAALTAADRALKLNPKDDVALANRGVALLRMGRNRQALVTFERALKRDETASNHHNRALALRGLQRNGAALNALERAVALQDDHTGAWMELLVTALELDQSSRASEAVEVLRDLKPNWAGARLNTRAWPLVDPDREDRSPDVELGLRLARAAAELIPADIDLLDTLAWALFANGLTAEALAESTRAVELASEDRRAEYEKYRDRLLRMIESDKVKTAPAGE